MVVAKRVQYLHLLWSELYGGLHSLRAFVQFDIDKSPAMLTRPSWPRPRRDRDIGKFLRDETETPSSRDETETRRLTVRDLMRDVFLTE